MRWFMPAIGAGQYRQNGSLHRAGRGPADRQLASLRDLVDDLQADRVQVLLIIGGNPVYNSPAELDFAEQLRRSLGIDSESHESPLRLCVHLSDYYNETSLLSHWHIPAAHELESWSDARAFDGTATILQPLIAPLYEGKTAHELLSVLAGDSSRPAYDIVREYWQSQLKGDFESAWRHAVHDGVVPGHASPPVETGWVFRDRLSSAARTPADESKFELVFRPDPTIWDGRFSNSAWLQELPKPLTKLTWDNAALVSPETAQLWAGLAGRDQAEAGRAARSPPPSGCCRVSRRARSR